MTSAAVGPRQGAGMLVQSQTKGKIPNEPTSAAAFLSLRTTRPPGTKPRFWEETCDLQRSIP